MVKIVKDINDYFLKKTKNVSFIELKPESEVYIKNFKIDTSIPLPLIIDELISEIKQGKANEEVKVSSIINGIVYILGADPDFKYAQQYKEILYNFDNKIEDYILYTGLKKINENDLENGIVWLRALYNINRKNYMGVYNYGLSLEEKAKRLIKAKNQKLGNVFLNKSTNIFEKILNEKPDFDLAYYKLGYHYKNSNQYIKCSLMWEKYLQLGKDTELLDEIRENLESIKDDVTYEKGYNEILSGKSRNGLDKLIPLKDKYPNWWNLLFMIGLGYRQLKMFEESIVEFQAVLEIVPKQVDAMNELGLCLAAIGKNDEAISTFSKAIELRPKDYEIICNRGMTYLQINDIENAEKDINLAYEICNTDEITILCKKELERIKSMA